MLVLHEVHRMVGKREKEFEAAYQAWMAALAEDEGTRLLWFLHHAHGTGPSYQAVTITGLADGAAWERLAQRVHRGDLRGWAREVDGCRHDVQGRLLMPQMLRDAAQIKGEVAVLGNLTYLEVRNLEAFRKEIEEEKFTPEDEKTLDELGI